MICSICKKEFTPRNICSKYCSSKCAKEADSFRARLSNYKKRFDENGMILCSRCHIKFKPKTVLSLQTICPDCLEEQKRVEAKNARAAEKARRVTDKFIGKANRTFDDWQREADECNMTYGDYRAQIEVFGKTYEQLKATADHRQVQCHSHVGAGRNRRD